MLVLNVITSVCTHNYNVTSVENNKSDSSALSCIIYCFEAKVRDLLTNLAQIYSEDNKRDFNDVSHVQCAEIMLLCCTFIKKCCKVDVPI